MTNYNNITKAAAYQPEKVIYYSLIAKKLIKYTKEMSKYTKIQYLRKVNLANLIKATKERALEGKTNNNTV